MYRWLDAEGQVHLGETPPAGAHGVERVDGAGGGAVINVAPQSAEPPRAKATAPARSERGSSPGATRERDEDREPSSIGGKSEGQWRSEALRLEERIERERQKLQKAEEQLSNAYALGSSAYYQRRVDSAKAAVEDSEGDLERLEDRARELGVPPGWLRE
jgi:hypothetical protein